MLGRTNEYKDSFSLTVYGQNAKLFWTNIKSCATKVVYYLKPTWLHWQLVLLKNGIFQVISGFCVFHPFVFRHTLEKEGNH